MDYDVAELVKVLLEYGLPKENEDTVGRVLQEFYDEAQSIGYNDGYDSGSSDGYSEGYDAGRWEAEDS